MQKVIELLKQRRVWATLVGVLTFGATTFGLKEIVDPSTFIDLLHNWGVAMSDFIKAAGGLIAATLALWSFLKPKK